MYDNNADQMESNPQIDQQFVEPKGESKVSEQTDHDRESIEVYREFLTSGVLRDGWAVNVMWPEKARKIGEG